MCYKIFFKKCTSIIKCTRFVQLFITLLSPSRSYVCHYSLRSLTLRLRLTPRNKNAVNLIYADVGNLGIVGIILLIRYWHQYSISDCSHGLLLRSVRIYRKYSHLKHEGLTPISLARDFFILSILYGVAGECLSGMRSRKDMQTVSLMCIGDTAVQCTQAYYEDSL